LLSAIGDLAGALSCNVTEAADNVTLIPDMFKDIFIDQLRKVIVTQTYLQNASNVQLLKPQIVNNGINQT